ncbi:MAG: glycosyltransferase family A protein [Pseudomonadota bacterium]
MGKPDASLSVIMPMKDNEAFVLAALRSIAAQAIRPLEIFVIDDGSTDRSRQIVADYGKQEPAIVLLDGPQKGPAAARNVGLRQARGDFIAFLDSDDIWPEDKLAKQMPRFDRQPPVDVVSGFVQYFTDDPAIDLKPDDASLLDEVFHVHLGASIFRKRVFDKLGLFDDSFTYSEDVDLMLRIRDSDTPMTILDTRVLYYRRHPNSMTSRYTVNEKRDFNRALMRSMARRKANGVIIEKPTFGTLVERLDD